MGDSETNEKTESVEEENSLESSIEELVSISVYGNEVKITGKTKKVPKHVYNLINEKMESYREENLLMGDEFYTSYQDEIYNQHGYKILSEE